MNGLYWLNYLWSWAYWFVIPLAIIFLIARALARRNWKKVDDYYKKSWTNQEEMITLLKEIRDSLKK